MNNHQISAQKLGFLRRVLTEMGYSAGELLATEYSHSNTPKEDMATTSVANIIKVYKYIAALGLPSMALEVGKRIQCSDYGLYGCTLLCKKTLEDSLHFAIKYHSLATRTTQFYLTPYRNNSTLFACDDILQCREIKGFNLELQLAINLSLVREIVGDPDFVPLRIYCQTAKPAYYQDMQNYAGCELLFEQDVTGIELNNRDLALPLTKSNPLALPVLVKLCDEYRLSFSYQSELIKQTYSWVSQNLHSELNIEKLATHLCTSERTLRRRLSDKGTSFSSICGQVKREFAIKYVSETLLSFDDVAESLGFSETSNFRRAFKTWTGITPTAYRKSYQSQ